MKKGKGFFVGLVMWIMGAAGILFGVPSAFAAYQNNGNGTVTDTSTGLMWQQDTARDSQGAYDAMTWEEALAYCETRDLGGHTDWRLPTIKELCSLVDYGEYSPAINRTFFPNTVSSGYWSSTTYAHSTDRAWSDNFSYGYDGWGNKDGGRYVRAVRGGQSGSFGNLDHFVISVVSSPQAVGVPFNVAITAADAAGNRVQTFNGSVNLSVPGGIYPSRTTLLGGGATVSVTLYSGGWTRINCSGYGVGGLSNCFDVSGGSACSGKIFGKVVDAKGNAVNQADVRLYSCQGQEVKYKETGADGKYSFSGFSCGTYDIKAEKDDYSSEPVDVSVASTMPQKLEDLRLQISGGTGTTPVILVMGMMGSTTCVDCVYPRLSRTMPCKNLYPWDFNLKAGWNELFVELINQGFWTYFCPWDWRMDCDGAYKQYLIPKIDEALKRSSTGKVDIVAHSMGGCWFAPTSRAAILKNETMI